jgi:hypothetical protein
VQNRASIVENPPRAERGSGGIGLFRRRYGVASIGVTELGEEQARWKSRHVPRGTFGIWTMFHVEQTVIGFLRELPCAGR